MLSWIRCCWQYKIEFCKAFERSERKCQWSWQYRNVCLIFFNYPQSQRLLQSYVAPIGRPLPVLAIKLVQKVHAHTHLTHQAVTMGQIVERMLHEDREVERSKIVVVVMWSVVARSVHAMDARSLQWERIGIRRKTISFHHFAETILQGQS